MLVGQMLQCFRGIAKLHRVPFFGAKIDEESAEGIVFLYDLAHTPTPVTAVGLRNERFYFFLCLGIEIRDVVHFV